MQDKAPRRLRVLVVGDEHDTVMTLGILLRSEGVEVRLATGGQQVPAAAAQFQPDAVLLDLATPAQSGVAVAQELMKSCGDRCPILHHVKKPIDPDALLKLVLSITLK
jgi:DNA-binding response OmpR family regulator